jgi:hypothetical protein
MCGPFLIARHLDLMSSLELETPIHPRCELRRLKT